MATTATRLGALGMLTALVVGGVLGRLRRRRSPSAAPASQPASAPAPSAPASAEASPSEANAEPVTLTYFVDDNNVTAGQAPGPDRRLHRSSTRTSRSRSRPVPAAPRATTSSRPGSRPAT